MLDVLKSQRGIVLGQRITGAVVMQIPIESSGIFLAVRRERTPFDDLPRSALANVMLVTPLKWPPTAFLHHCLARQPAARVNSTATGGSRRLGFFRPL